MILQSLMMPTMLLIEDREKVLAANENYINQIDFERRKMAGIAEFRIDKTTSVNEAIKLLTRNIQSPYHIVLLDLHLPDAETDQFESGSYHLYRNSFMKFRGYEVLSFIEETKAAESVIVVSGFPREQLNVFRKGASDFIRKPRHKEELQERVLICWSRLLLKKSQQILAQRIKDLVPYAEKGLAHRFTTCFSRLVQTVTHNAEDIERYIQERYGLERRKDAEDPLFTYLKSQEDSVSKIQKEWMELQTALLPQDEASKAETIEALLQNVHQSLLPCLIVKTVTLEYDGEANTRILTFGDDVLGVLKEIIIGAINTIPDYEGTERKISVEIKKADGQVSVRFLDSLEPIPLEYAAKINEGSNITPYRRFSGREWGLSVAQHIAMRGGGRLEVEPQQSQGNVVTYYIPSAQ